MSSALERTWVAVIAGLDGRPESTAALVRALDRLDKLDELKQAVLSEAAAELRADREPPVNTHKATRWLHRQLAHGERRVQQLKADAARDGIGWRTLERRKRDAGVTAKRHDNASWWSHNSATPPPPAACGGTLDR